MQPSSAIVPDPQPRQLRVAVLVPCFNEGAAIGQVITDFRRVLPEADIYVYDNNSTDDTRAIASKHGAVVRSEPLQGKGNVVRRMFADIESDAYVLVDGDGTYDAQAARPMLDKLLAEDLDMVTGVRVADSSDAYRLGHVSGNRLLTGMVASIFGKRCGDMLSGYRIFSRRFVKSFPALASGFEIETELTVHALELRMPIADVPTHYGARAAGSSSKLHTIRDGMRIVSTVVQLAKDERPMQFFSLLAAIFALTALLLGYPLLETYLETHLVPRFPTAILAMGLVILSFLSFTAGVILDSVVVGRRELKRLRYLEIPLNFRERRK